MDCEMCADTGYTCAECGEADGECLCDDGPDLVRCTDCNYYEDDNDFDNGDD